MRTTSIRVRQKQYWYCIHVCMESAWKGWLPSELSPLFLFMIGKISLFAYWLWSCVVTVLILLTKYWPLWWSLVQLLFETWVITWACSISTTHGHGISRTALICALFPLSHQPHPHYLSLPSTIPVHHHHNPTKEHEYLCSYPLHHREMEMYFLKVSRAIVYIESTQNCICTQPTFLGKWKGKLSPPTTITATCNSHNTYTT